MSEVLIHLGVLFGSVVLVWLGVFAVHGMLEKPWNWFVNTVEATWFLVSSPLRRNIPEQVDYDKVRELEQWNTSWCHPELGNFYFWDPYQGYVELPSNLREGLDNGTAKLKDSSKRQGYEVGDRRYKTLKAAEQEVVDGYGETVRRVWSLAKPGMRTGSWCKTCHREAHGAEYCDRCKENYGFRERDLRGECGWDRAPGANRRSLQQYFGVTPDAIWGPDTEHHVRWEAEQGRLTDVRKVLFSRDHSRCKGCGITISGVECCSSCERQGPPKQRDRSRCKDTRVGFDDLPEDSMIRLLTIDGRTAHCTKGQLRQARRRYWFELGERGLDAAMYAAMQVLIGDEILEDLQRLPDKTQYEVIEQIHKLVTDDIPGEKRCDWCGEALPSVPHTCLRHPGEKFCTNKCWILYHTEP